MSDMKINDMIEILPEYSRQIPVSDNKFLLFFPPVIIDDKFLFGLSFKTGVQIFAIISLIQTISSFFDIFSPGSLWLFIVAIFAFVIYFVISLYAFLATIKNNYTYAKVSYLISSVLFLLQGLKYLCKSVIKIIEFITPWDGDFLRLDFLIYIFGHGFYLFFYLYFIYILYRYMIELSNQHQGGDSIPLKNEEEEEKLNDNKEQNV